MKKWLKITLYIILILAIFVVVWLMFWNTNMKTPSNTEIEIWTWGEISNIWEVPNNGNTDTFEEDVMKDLEWFFGNNNWYEDVEWEYWFTEPENE